MTSDQWPQINQLFQAALERPAGERAAFLESAGADPAVRRQVEDLLAAHEQAPTFLESPAWESAPAGDAEADDEVPVAGGRIGAYRVVREIGRGGMGAVYLAERADGRFEKQVAIKVIKRGLDTDAVRRRFRTEQQILAQLDHPHMAKLLDGGTTVDGLPYFIMDYVDGVPIDAYCATHGLPTEDRLRLFLAVCAAVEYAHQRQVVHRDIKPGNILVTAAGEPRLLDFGIAKVLTPEPSAGTTGAAAWRPLTPEYASPEQVRGGAVTTASDVYSLGVLLHELLTGRRAMGARRRVRTGRWGNPARRC